MNQRLPEPRQVTTCSCFQLLPMRNPLEWAPAHGAVQAALHPLPLLVVPLQHTRLVKAQHCAALIKSSSSMLTRWGATVQLV